MTLGSAITWFRACLIRGEKSVLLPSAYAFFVKDLYS